MSELIKGKWKACVDGSVDIEDDNGHVIETYCDIIGQQKEESEIMLNARLIAAAPEMYDLLKLIVKIHDCMPKTAAPLSVMAKRCCELIAQIEDEEGK